MRQKLARVLFDLAVNSADFGSGFMDDEDVAALREAAKVLGVDPMEATPSKFRCWYRGYHQADVYLDSPYFFDPGGVPRNAYRNRKEFPKGTKLKGIGNDCLGMSPAKVLRMYCTECHQHWDVLDCPARLKP